MSKKREAREFFYGRVLWPKPRRGMTFSKQHDAAWKQAKKLAKAERHALDNGWGLKWSQQGFMPSSLWTLHLVHIESLVVLGPVRYHAYGGPIPGQDDKDRVRMLCAEMALEAMRAEKKRLKAEEEITESEVPMLGVAMSDDEEPDDEDLPEEAEIPDAVIDAFKAAWEAADRDGKVGNRVRAGLRAALRVYAHPTLPPVEPPTKPIPEDIDLNDLSFDNLRRAHHRAAEPTAKPEGMTPSLCTGWSCQDRRAAEPTAEPTAGPVEITNAVIKEAQARLRSKYVDQYAERAQIDQSFRNGWNAAARFVMWDGNEDLCDRLRAISQGTRLG